MPKIKLSTEKKDYKLFEANDIAKFGIMSAAGNTLSPIAYKALMYLIWKCNQETPGKFKKINLSVTELGEALGYQKDRNCNFSHNVKRVCSVIEKIMSQPITIRNTDLGEIRTFVWLQEVDINYKKDHMKVLFSHALSEYFGQEITDNFTVVKLKYLNRLTTTAAVVLYPFFCRYLAMGTFNYSIEELSKLLTGTPHYEYKRLKGNCIMPAIESINTLTDLHVEFKELKQGRRVTSISFSVSKQPAADEMKCFMEHNKLKFDEINIVPYNELWMANYAYDMASQSYKYISC